MLPTVANYDYLGASRLIGTELSQAWAENKYYSYSSGTHLYAQLDNFGRVLTSDWYRTGVTGRDHGLIANSIAYDQASNIVSVTDEVHNNDNGTTVKGLYDVVYTNDDLGRLLKAESGNMVGTAIESGSRKRYEEWSLDATGNWLNDKLDLDGDANYTGTGERDATNTFDLANKYTLRNAKSQGQNNYYHVGNQLKYALLDGSTTKQGYRYDAFGRMTEYTTDVTSNSSGDIRAKYRYNGLNQRIMWQYDAIVNGTLTDDERYYFVYDAKWRMVASMRDQGSADPDTVTVQEAFVYHAAGLAGSGGSSYIDSVILRDTDDFKWVAKSSNVLDTRTFYVQNWRSDVMAILDSDGNPLERVRYTAYGTPSSHPIADIDGNGTVEPADQTQWAALLAGGTNSAVYAQSDLNADGLFPDTTDEDFFAAQYARVGAGSVFGINKLSSVASRKGYAGYEWDLSITSWHVRHRVLDSASGKWTRMDPLGYVDGASQLSYVVLSPITRVDTQGQQAVINPGALPGYNYPQLVPAINESESDVVGHPSYSTRCARECKSQECGGCNGFTDPGKPACICFGNIRDWVPTQKGVEDRSVWPSEDIEEVVMIIAACVMLHEATHRIETGTPTRECREYVGNYVELDCLEKNAVEMSRRSM